MLCFLEAKKSTLGLEANKLLTGLSETLPETNGDSDDQDSAKSILQLDHKPKKENNSRSKTLEALNVLTSLEDKKESNAFENNDMLMGNSTYQPQIARSLMDSREKVEVDAESVQKLDDAFNNLKESVTRSEGYLAEISRIMMGMPKKNEKEEKKEAGSDRLDLKIIEVNNDDKKHN
ncbi:hypothetical protein GVAV_000860 [Gurleya vavrai]